MEPGTEHSVISSDPSSYRKFTTVDSSGKDVVQHLEKCGTDFVNSNYLKNHPGEYIKQQRIEKNSKK